MNRFVTTAILGMTTPFINPANASTLPDPQSVIVEYATLNLDTATGIATLYRRIERAAEKVCAPLKGTRELVRQQLHRTCIQDAVGRAVTAVDRPPLSELYRSKHQGRDFSRQHLALH